MELNLTDHVAIVTGGGRGIGAAIAREFATQGAHVAVVCLPDDEDADTVRRDIEGMDRRCLLVHADVSDFGGAERAVREISSEFGRIDALICNAGITRDAVAWKMTEEQWDRVIDVNLKGCFNYCRAVAPVLRKHNHGSIVNLSSINGLRGKFGQTNYAASKGAIVALTKSLARELGQWNITVNAVAPGLVDTEMTRQLPTEFRNEAIRETAIGRMGTPEDVSGLIAFLCSSRARHMTGQVIQIDGGQYM